MKQILITLSLFFSLAASSQVVLPYKVSGLTALAAYNGAANKITVDSTGQEYILCTSCTVDGTTVILGASSKKWKKIGVSGVYNVASYNIYPNGNDMTATFTSMLASVYTLGGGTVQFNAGTYRFDGQIKIPNSGTNPAAQPSLRFIGAGHYASAYSGTASGVASTAGILTQLDNMKGGTTLDVRYQGDSTRPFIDTRGAGQFEMAELSIIAGVNLGTTPFFHTTNTISNIHDCYFEGYVAGQDATQDAIVLGGSNANEMDTSVNGAYQGYGSIVRRNHFNKINRGVYGRTYSNHAIVENNTFWTGCGGEEGILFDGGAANLAGVVITGNLFEVGGYQYGIRLKGNLTAGVFDATLSYNSFYDQSARTIAGIRIDTGSNYNYVQEGYYNQAIIGTLDYTKTATIVTAQQNKTSYFGSMARRGTDSVQANTGTVVGTATTNYHSWSAASTTAVQLGVNGTGILQIENTSSTVKKIKGLGTNETHLVSGGILRLQGSEVYVGTNSNIYNLSGSDILNFRGTSGGIRMNNTARLGFNSTTSAGSTAEFGYDSLVRIGVFQPSSTTLFGDLKLRKLVQTGGLYTPITTTAGASSLTFDNGTVILTSTVGTTILPSATANNGLLLRLVNYNAGGAVTLSAVAGSILRDGSAVTSIPNNAKWIVQSDGTNWYVIAE